MNSYTRNKCFQFSLLTLLGAIIVCAIGTKYWIDLSRSLVVHQMPRPYSGEASFQKTSKQFTQDCENSVGVSYQHPSIMDWRRQLNGAHVQVHVDRNGTLQTIVDTGFADTKAVHANIGSVQKSIQSVLMLSAPRTVLLTSDTDGWRDLRVKKDLVESLFDPSVSVYMIHVDKDRR